MSTHIRHLRGEMCKQRVAAVYRSLRFLCLGTMSFVVAFFFPLQVHDDMPKESGRKKSSSSDYSEDEPAEDPTVEAEEEVAAGPSAREDRTSPSLTPARGRSTRRRRSAVSESEDRARGSARPRSPSRSPAASGKGKGKGESKGRQARQRCPICWQRCGNYPHALVQHQRWSVQCLQWQHFRRGRLSWEDCYNAALATKDRREREAYERNSAEAAQALASKERDLRGAHKQKGRSPEKTSKKRKEETGKKKKRKYESTPSPVRHRPKHPKPPPPSSSGSDQPRKASGRKHPRTLVINLPR